MRGQQAIEGVNFLIERGSDGLVVMSNVLDDEDIVALGPYPVQRVVVINHDFASIPGQCFTVDHDAGGRHRGAHACWSWGIASIAVIAGRAERAGQPASVSPVSWRSWRRPVHRQRPRCGWRTDEFTPEGGWACAERLLAVGL